eukprot:gene16292-2282_t
MPPSPRIGKAAAEAEARRAFPQRIKQRQIAAGGFPPGPPSDDPPDESSEVPPVPQQTWSALRDPDWPPFPLPP